MPPEVTLDCLIEPKLLYQFPRTSLANPSDRVPYMWPLQPDSLYTVRFPRSPICDKGALLCPFRSGRYPVACDDIRSQPHTSESRPPIRVRAHSFGIPTGQRVASSRRDQECQKHPRILLPYRHRGDAEPHSQPSDCRPAQAATYRRETHIRREGALVLPRNPGSRD
jgi:hypothetical protein